MSPIQQIGCAEESIVRIIRNGRKIFETDKANFNWERKVDEASTASFNIPVNCCPPRIHAWADYIEHERDGVIEWTGYAMRPEFDGNDMNIEAQDLLFGYQRRTIKTALDHVDVDLSTIFTDYAAAASEYDPLPVVLSPNDSGILGTRMVTVAEYRMAWSAMKELLDTGLDVTTVGRRIFVGPLNAASLPPIRLTERMIKGGLQPKIGEDGAPYANRVIVKGANGLVSIYPTGTPAAPNDSYPLVEAVIDASDIDDQGSLDQLALDQHSIRSQVPTFFSMDQGIALKETAPFALGELIAGRLVNLVFDSSCGLISQAMRIARVVYTLSGLQEAIQIELAPAGLVQASELVSA